ncbi:MobH family relaxase [Pseudoalteromonas sp. Angola-7]|uniref:MobH family relaxase n=1 Tax=Pseudoalteromonas sp. Angola-7 TaxID=3025336 RepID=UPI0023585E3A|nr:MobH family relaxase [Pseudoalteromonas sp. Angola-7]MDC9530217.1 MobH family relaxase [Pseudoalteromonas sp. Angola-7]
MSFVSTMKMLLGLPTSKTLNHSNVEVLKDNPKPIQLQTNVTGEIYLDIYNRPVHDAEAQFYPPKVNGLSVFCVDAILKRYKDQIIALEQHVDIGFHRTTEDGINLFEARYLSVIRKLAEYVHMLPASEYHHHSQPGGLFRHSLDAALIALRKADNQLPPTVGKVDLDAQRRIRYMYAAWVGALLHDTGKILTDMQVSAYTIFDDEQNMCVPIASWSKSIKPWVPQIETLIEWATRNKVERYFVHFRASRVHKEHVSSGATLLPHILKGEGLEFIMDSPDDLYSNLTSALNGYAHINGYLATAIRFGDSVSTAKDVKTMATSAFGNLKKSRMMSIVDTMRSLKSKWNFNAQKGHAFVIGDCVFIRWQSAFDGILKAARANQHDSLPNDTKSLLGMMEDFRIVEPFDKDNRFALFAIGKFTEKDVIDIIDEKISISWIELIKVVYREWIYDSDPVHPNLEGLLYLSTTNKYFITKEDGSFTELSFDTTELNIEKETVIEDTNELHDKVKISPAKNSVSVKTEATHVNKNAGTTKTENTAPSQGELNAGKKNKDTPKKTKMQKPKKPEKANVTPIQFENSSETTAEQATPSAQSEKVNPTPQSERATPSAQSEEVTPTPQSEKVNPTPQSERATPSAQSEEVTPTPQTEQVTPPALEKGKRITQDYVLQINNKWYVDVNKYVKAYDTNQIEAGQALLDRGFIRQKLGSSSLATLVRRQKGNSVVCFELTPLGKSTLMGSVKSSVENTEGLSSKPKGVTTKTKVTAGKDELSLTSSDNTEFEFTTTSIKGSLGEILLAHKIKVAGGPEQIDIVLKDVALASDSHRSFIKGIRISKLIQLMKARYKHNVTINDMSSFSIQVHIHDVSNTEVFSE